MLISTNLAVIEASALVAQLPFDSVTVARVVALIPSWIILRYVCICLFYTAFLTEQRALLSDSIIFARVVALIPSSIILKYSFMDFFGESIGLL